MTGTSGDMRDVLAARERGELDAELAVDVYVRRLRREIGALAASLAAPQVASAKWVGELR